MVSSVLGGTGSTNNDNDGVSKYSLGTPHARHAAHLAPVRPFPPFKVIPLLPIPPSDHIVPEALGSQGLVSTHIPNDPPIGKTTLSDYAQSSQYLRATPNMDIAHFCEHILSSPTSAGYKIFSLAMYQEVRVTIEHTYILLGVQPSHGQPFYLRLNRAAGRYRNLWLRLRSISSKFPAKDCVIISWNEESLHCPPMDVLSHVTFQRDNPCLRDLAILLNIIAEESRTYTLYPQNCWFFCSVIHELLTGTFPYSGSMKPVYQTLCPKIRATIANRWDSERNLPRCE